MSKQTVTIYDPDSRSYEEHEVGQITDRKRMDFIEQHPKHLASNRRGQFYCVNPFTNYSYPVFNTAREAIDWCIKEGRA